MRNYLSKWALMEMRKHVLLLSSQYSVLHGWSVGLSDWKINTILVIAYCKTLRTRYVSLGAKTDNANFNQKVYRDRTNTVIKIAVNGRSSKWEICVLFLFLHFFGSHTFSKVSLVIETLLMKTSRISIKWIWIICAYDSHIYSMLNYNLF